MKASPSDTLIRETRALAQTTPYQHCKKSKGRKWAQKRNTHPVGVGIENDRLPQRGTYTPWMSLLRGKQSGSIKSKLHNEIVAYDSWLRLTEQEKIARRIIVECIETLVKEHIASDARVELFGSSATGLCLPTSDIDIMIATPQRWGEVFQNRVLAQLTCLVRDVRLTSYTTAIPHAQVPILKFPTTNSFGNFNVDISICHGEGIPGNLKEVNAHLAKIPVLRSLVMVIKTLVAKHGLHNQAACGLGSYAIICMCIYFINANPFQRPHSYFATPYASESLGILLSDFFWHFSNNFPFSTSMISPTDGKLYPNLEPLDTAVSKRIHVQCLVHPENNVTKFVDQKTLEALVSIFRKACHEILKSKVRDRTILGKIITIDKWALKIRSRVRGIMDRESLDDAVTGMKRRAQSKRLSTVQCDLGWQVRDQQDVVRQYMTRSRASRSESSHSYHFSSGRDDT